MLAYLVAGLTATVLVTAVGWFWKLCFETEGPAEPRSPGEDRPQAPGSSEDDTPLTTGSPEGDTPPPDSPEDDTPLTTGSPEGDTPPPGSPEGDTPPPDSPEGDTPLTTGSPGDAAPPPDSTLDSPGEAPPPTPDPPLDDAPPAPAETDVPTAPPGVRWSWRTHRQSGLEFLRVTVTNPGPNPLTVTGIALRTSDEVARHADPPADLLGASEQAADLFGQDSGAAPLPRTLEPDGSVDAYFPCRDVADWLYDVAESHNIDRNECHLTPECIDSAGGIHPARRKVDYERWLRHGNGPSLREQADRQDLPPDGDDQ